MIVKLLFGRNGFLGMREARWTSLTVIIEAAISRLDLPEIEDEVIENRRKKSTECLKTEGRHP